MPSSWESWSLRREPAWNGSRREDAVIFVQGCIFFLMQPLLLPHPIFFFSFPFKLIEKLTQFSARSPIMSWCFSTLLPASVGWTLSLFGAVL